jgi:hypothetical protein
MPLNRPASRIGRTCIGCRRADFVTQRMVLNPTGKPDRRTCIECRRADFVTRTDGALNRPASRIGRTWIETRGKT